LAEQAWFGIVKKIAHLLAPLISPAPIVGTSEERTRRANMTVLSKRSLVEFCLSESSNLLSVQKYQLAIPAACQALKFCAEVDGERSLAVVEPYLQLAQSYLGLKQLGKAEEYLALARWIVLNSEECSDKVRSRMHMLMGRVSTSQGKFEEAKPELASAIFYMSRCQGAEAVATSMGYFRLGDVFLAQGSVEVALAFFDKVVDIWYKYLTALHTSTTTTPNMDAVSSGAAQPEGDFNSASGNLNGTATTTLVASTPILETLNEEQLSDGRAHLEQIMETRKRLLGIGHIATGEVHYTIGLFEFFLLGNEGGAESFIVSALKAYETILGADHPSTKHVMGVLELVRLQQEAKYVQFQGGGVGGQGSEIVQREV